MKVRYQHIGNVIFFGFLLVILLIFPFSLKRGPEIALLIFGILCFSATLSRIAAIQKVLFGILLFLSLSYAIFILSHLSLDYINPQEGWTDVDGVPKKVMSMRWLACGCIAILTSIPLLRLYFRHLQVRLYEVAFSFLFTAIILAQILLA